MSILKRTLRVGLPILVISVLTGMIFGVGSFTFVYGKGWSYLTNDPKACMNCHIMTEQYNGWVKSSHHAFTTCNSCHTPKNIVAKYIVKGINGYEHSLAFTTGNFPDPIKIKKLSFKVTQNACIDCHSKLWEGPRSMYSSHIKDKGRQCMHCHQSVGH